MALNKDGVEAGKVLTRAEIALATKNQKKNRETKSKTSNPVKETK